MIRIITDSTADFSLEHAKELNVGIVPLTVIINGKEYKDRTELQPEEFYKILEENDVTPTTSQPSPKDFLDVYQPGIDNKDSIIVFTLSSKVSGTYQSANIAKDLSEYEDIHIIDTLTSIPAQRIIVEKACELRDAGKSVQEIIDFIEVFKTKVKLFAMVDTLEYFYKGGRLSKSSATIGNLLKMKPIISLVDGKLELVAKSRGTKKATAKIIDLINESGEIDLNEKIYLGYTGSDDMMDKFEAILREELGIKNLDYSIVGPAIGTHAGPGAKVIIYVEK